MLLLLSLFACKEPITRPFPDGFLWGSSTAGFQVDMGCPTWSDDVCVDPASDWYQWVTDPDVTADPGLHVAGEDVRNGPGMWELFEEDVATMKRDGFGGFRMSIEWSRLFPDPAAASATTVEALAAHADPAAVARYHEMFAALDAAGIHPLVTINHYTLPLWVHDGKACHEDLDACEADGWVTGERIVPLIALYAGYCGMEFGGEVDTWATLNEPFATTLSGYLMPGEDRSAPPGLSFNGAATAATVFHQIEGHAAMYDALHANDAVDADGDGAAAEVGLVLNMIAIAPRDAGEADDLEAVEEIDYLYHRVFLDAITSGAWDADLDGVQETSRPELAGRLDYLGINYYNRIFAQDVGVTLLPEVPVATFVPEVTWEPYTAGMAEVVAKGAAYGLPILITENGTVTGQDAANVLDGHLASLHEAIEAGADVRGYFYWSYVDNYEWNHGMAMKFGLYELDVATKARIERPVMARYREIMARGGLE